MPLEVRVPRNQIKSSSPVNTIDLKVSAAISSEQNEDPEPDLDSREEFPELNPSKDKKKMQPRNLTRKIEGDTSARQPNETGLMGKKDHIKNLEQKWDHNESLKQCNEHKGFKYEHQGNILNFEFVTDKRIKCPTCKKEFKNIIRHLQQSSCEISNIDDLNENLKQFKKVHLAEQIKEDQIRWK